MTDDESTATTTHDAATRPTVSSSAARLAAALTSEAVGSRLMAHTVSSAFAQAFPATASTTQARAMLAVLLEELDDVGAIHLPKTIKGWDSGNPRLPLSIRIPTQSADEPQHKAVGVAWRPELAWAATARLTASQIEDLRRINRWLRDNDTSDGGISSPIPMRERSIEIFDDEKHLDRLLPSTLFAPGRLTLAMLGAVRVPPPLATTRIGDGPMLLVIENSDTYATMTALLTDEPGRVGMVGFGGGRAFEASVLGLAGTSGITEIGYFGDLDADGLSIPARASVAATAVGLPAVEPAAGLYELLLGQQPQKADRVVPRWTADALAAWLSSDLRGRAAQLLVSGHRIAQERTGRTLLQSHTRWRSTLSGWPASHAG